MGRGRGRRVLGGLLDASGLAPAALAPLAGYLAVVTAAAGVARRRGEDRTPRHSEPGTRFAVVIPAHDEEQLIASTVDSVRAQQYPSELVAVHVVADHCTDDTVAIARSAGARVHEHVDPHPAGKGAALRWVLQRLLSTRDDIDAVVLLDADSVLDREFLAVMDARLQRGAVVVQGHYAVRDMTSSDVVAIRSAALALRHLVRPLGRTTLGCSSGLYGNGMVARSELLRRRAWSDHLTEDLEFQIELLLDEDVVVDFAPDAVVRAEMPSGLEQSRSQNERWEQGRLELVKRFVPRLLRAARHGPAGRRVRLVDTALDSLVPPLSVLTAATVATAAWSAVVFVGRRSAASRLGLALATTTCVGLFTHVVGGLWLARLPRPVIASLVGAPRMVLWKSALWTRLLVRRRGVAWTRTARNTA